MKLMHEQIDFPGLSPVKVKVREMPYFTYPWHFHDEYEILYVIDGFGTRFIADNIESFQSGDLVLIGSNVPHFWRSDDTYMDGDGKLNVNYIVIQFPSGFLKEEIKNYPEYHLIGELLSRSTRGIKFDAGFSKRISGNIKKIAKKTGLERILLLQELLQLMAKSTNFRLLAGELYKAELHDFTSDRLTKVMLFLNTNYQQKIELGKVADIANLHPSAFCRYFKSKTGKSLSEYVNDMRVSYACRLIIDGKMSISQIGFESGFNNLSNFNRTFKKNTGFTPSDYFQEFNRR